MTPREAADTARALVEDLDAWLSDQPDEETRAAATQTKAILVALGPLVAAAEQAEEDTERLIRLAGEREAAAERADTLEAALTQYADPRHWSIARDEGFDLARAVWIGPGSIAAVHPDAPMIARAALAAGAEEDS